MEGKRGREEERRESGKKMKREERRGQESKGRGEEEERRQHKLPNNDLLHFLKRDLTLLIKAPTNFRDKYPDEGVNLQVLSY